MKLKKAYRPKPKTKHSYGGLKRSGGNRADSGKPMRKGRKGKR